MEEKVLIEIINELRESYEEYRINHTKEEIQVWVQKFKEKYKINELNIDIYFNKAWGAGPAELEKMNILFKDRSSDLYYNINKRTTGGYYVIISDLDKEKVNIRIDFSDELTNLWYKDNNVKEIITKEIYTKAFEDLEKKGKKFKYINSTQSIYYVEINDKLNEYVNELEDVIKNYPKIMKEYLENNSELEKKYDIKFDIYKKASKNKKKGRLFTKYIWSLVYNIENIEPDIEQAENIDLDNEEYDNSDNMINFDRRISKNSILYGPPGTGKTYKTAIYAVAICDGKSIEELEKRSYDDVLLRYEELRKEGKIAFTTFHQSYGYEEFIEGIKPILESDKDENEKENDDKKKNISYDIKNGIFKEFCDNSKGKGNCVFIIDEINRGNISKIFGELITLIEESKRIEADEAMEVVLPYSGQTFGVPNNVYILGTMNTADRSIAIMDTALRRRFDFIEMMPEEKLLVNEKGEDIFVKDINIREMLETMNKRIEYLYDREHTLGHAFFMKLKKEPTLDNLANIFKNKIIPLLQEYFYEDYEKIRLVLGDNEGAKEDKNYEFIQKAEFDTNIFKGNYNIEDISDCIYKINENAFEQEESYKRIYNKESENE